MARNPRDVCVSYFNHWKILEGFHGSLDTFVDAFLGDVCGYYTPFLKHVREYWQLSKRSDNVLFIFYEDMKRDLKSVAKRVGDFLERPLDEGDVSSLVQHLSFENMRNNSAVNKQELVQECNKVYNNDAAPTAFMRSGRVGDWRRHLSQDQVRRFEAWEEKGLAGTDLKFTYECE